MWYLHSVNKQFGRCIWENKTSLRKTYVLFGGQPATTFKITIPACSPNRTFNDNVHNDSYDDGTIKQTMLPRDVNFMFEASYLSAELYTATYESWC